MPGILIREVEYGGEIGDVLVSPGCVARLDSHDHVIQGKGLVAVPAFADHHVHFRDPGFTEQEDLLSGSRAAAAGGYQRVECEPNTCPVTDNVAALTELDCRIEQLDTWVWVEPKCALTLGQRGEKLVDIAGIIEEFPLWANFSSDGEPVADRGLLVQALRLTDGQVRIDLHCEATPCSAQRLDAVLGPGPAMAREPELIRLALDALTEAGTGMLHIQHVSLTDSVRLIAEAKAQGLAVTAEVTPHHLLLSAEDIPLRHGEPDPNWKMNPPLRSREDMLAMRKALAEGVIDIVATDHAPHTLAEKSQGWETAPFGVVGLETAFGAIMTLVHQGHLSFDRLLSAMTESPEASRQHHIIPWSSEKWYYSDLTLVDPNARWTVDPDRFYSKGRNCPFAGITFKGRPIYTIIGGHLVMAEGEVLF